MYYDIGEVARVCSEKLSQLDVVSNNLANVATPGFKVEHLYPERKKEDNRDNNSFSPSSLLVDFSQGLVQNTGNPLDVAIQGEGFFAVQTQEGPAYTRRGNFLINPNNQLVTQASEPVMGEKGPLTILGNNVSIDNNGIISADGKEVDRLKVVRFTNPKALIRRGNGLFNDPGTGGVQTMERPAISPRQLELSNVNVIQEMVEMIDIQRSFESYQKVIQMMSDLDKLSTNRIGKFA